MSIEEAIAFFEDKDTIIENPSCLFTEIGEAWDMAVESMKKMDKIEKALDKISELADMDAFGDFQFGFRNGLWKAQTIVKEAMEK